MKNSIVMSGNVYCESVSEGYHLISNYIPTIPHDYTSGIIILQKEMLNSM